LQRELSKNSIMFITSEEFFAQPNQIVRSVYSFLELPSYDPIEIDLKNAGPSASISQETRAKLSSFFASHNEELYELVGRNLNWK